MGCMPLSRDVSIVTDAIRDSLETFMPNKRFMIDAANTFFKARECLNNQNPPYNIIISDLLLPRRGADIPETYQGRTLAGWCFLYHHILKSDGQYHDKYKDTKIILFSAYKSVWEQYIADNPLESSIDKNKVISVFKGDDLSDNDALVEAVKELFS